MEWIDGNIGSKVTMKYPSIYLVGEHAKGETPVGRLRGPGQHQDAGAKMIHLAPLHDSPRSSRSRSREAAAARATAARSGRRRTPTTRRKHGALRRAAASTPISR